MKKISSRQNQDIKNVTALHKKKERYAQKKFIAEGLRVCNTLLVNNYKLVHMYVTEKTQRRVHELVSTDKITLVDDIVMYKMSSVKTPSNILGVFELPQQPDTQKIAQHNHQNNSPGLVLANITDPGNMGTLIRSAAAMNAQHVVIVDGVDPFSPKVVQASAGTLAQIDIFQLSWEQLVKNKGNTKLCALVVFGGNKPQELNFKNSLLVIGNEAHGIAKKWIDDCEQKLTLPMPGNTESLNAAVAGSIALYLTL
ncbi:RNA methyltransferase [Candidatus Dependentiae bacterium]|nr:RNA methyltransferase [Candidatus Dependentiae bacterium]